MSKDETLTWRLEEDGGKTTVFLEGAITEDSNFGDLLPLVESKHALALDLSGVNRINSVGVREWVRFIRALGDREAFSMQACSPVIVSQLNMIANFVGAATVSSVLAPYVCDSCGAERTVFIDTANPPAFENLDTPPCGDCGEPMELDDLPESYFSFLSHVSA